MGQPTVDVDPLMRTIQGHKRALRRAAQQHLLLTDYHRDLQVRFQRALRQGKQIPNSLSSSLFFYHLRGAWRLGDRKSVV